MKTAPMFMLFAFCMGAVFLLAPNYHLNIQYERLSHQLIILYLVVLYWSSIPYEKLYSKIRWLFILMWAITCPVFNLYLNFPPSNDILDLIMFWGQPGGIPKSAAFQHGVGAGIAWLAYKPVILGGLFWKTYVLQRRYDTPGDPVNPENVHICLWRPHNARTLVQSLFGIAVGSVCIYVNGQLYGYRWGRSEYTVRTVPPAAMSRRFIIIDTGVTTRRDIIDHLNRIIGSPAGTCRLRCVWTIRHALKLIHPELAPSWYHFLPARYGIKLLKWRKTRG